MDIMALIGEYTKEKKDDGIERDVFLAKFTNGTLEQLKEISVFLKGEGFKIDDETDVIRTAISFLLSAKEKKEKIGNE